MSALRSCFDKILDSRVNVSVVVVFQAAAVVVDPCGRWCGSSRFFGLGH